MGHPKNVNKTISFVNYDELLSIIDTYRPSGQFVSVDQFGNCIAVDNSTEEAWQECFPVFTDAILYLTGPDNVNEINNHLVAIMDLEIGRQYDVKVGMTTYYVCRTTDNLFEIDKTTDGWVTAIATRELLFSILTGLSKFEDLKFH